jgi:drug/metabolite transporter (DMT)-like permease
MGRIDVLILTAVATSIALGQYFFKRVGVSIHGASPVGAVRMLMASPLFYAAIGLYATSTVLWIFALSRMPITRAYPWIMAASATVPIIGWLGFGERVSPGFWIGLIFVLVGLAITQFSLQS